MESPDDLLHSRSAVGLWGPLERLADARSRQDFASIVGLEETLAFNLSGHVLHRRAAAGHRRLGARLHLQYRNMRADFVEAMWDVVNWENVAARLARARAMAAV
jgi:hypothetical protein